MLWLNASMIAPVIMDAIPEKRADINACTKMRTKGTRVIVNAANDLFCKKEKRTGSEDHAEFQTT